MAVLTRRLLLALWLLLPSAAPAHMGALVPLAHAPGAENALLAHLAAEYMGEQMGREVRPLPCVTAERCFSALRERRAPMALLPSGGELPPDCLAVGPELHAPAAGYRLFMGEEAAGQLQFSLVSRYLERLSRALPGMPLKEAVDELEAGAPPRKVALELLRDADLI